MALRRRRVLAGLALAGAVRGVSAADDGRPPALRIGVLGDHSGIGAAVSGRPTVIAAEMAARDFGALPLDRPVEILNAQFHLKPDDALSIARHWFDDLGMHAIVDLPTSAAAVAVQDLARARNRSILNTSSINPDLTGRSCAPIATHWAIDSMALSNAVVRGLGSAGVRSWYLIAPDTPISLALLREARRSIEASGGRIVGLSQPPSGAAGYNAPVVEAGRSGAQAIGLCGVGSDLLDAIRQGRGAGLFAPDHAVAAFFAPISDIHAAGTAAAQGLLLADGFYWNDNESTRSFGARFQAAAGRMPGMSHAATYAAVQHLLRAVVAIDTLEADALNLEMRRTPVYFFGRTGRIRVDGRVLIDLTLYKVTQSGGSDDTWNCCAPVLNLAAGEVYRPPLPGACRTTP
jgi:branched-chain amino acid transport system substrate-binding protein